MSARENKIATISEHKRAILSPDVVAAIRAVVREEQKQIDREKDFQRLRALKSQAAQIERTLND